MHKASDHLLYSKRLEQPGVRCWHTGSELRASSGFCRQSHAECTQSLSGCDESTLRSIQAANTVEGASR